MIYRILKGTIISFSIFIILFSSCGDSSRNAKFVMPDSNPVQDNYSLFTSISDRSKWGAGNVHDPTIIKCDSIYYLFSTDAYYIPFGSDIFTDSIATGYIQIRTSNDLVHWNFEGWALDGIPENAIQHIHQYTDNKGANNIWAPYIKKVKDEFRLYYSVSCFGTNSSYIGLATSNSISGPWKDKGCIVKTNPDDLMNAIDPSVVTEKNTGKEWMIYGSFFGGLYCMELNPETGLAIKQDDKGHLVAARSEGKNHIIEAPEIIYNSDLNKYYLFVSYDPLFTHYNIRVGQSDSPQGPFYDMFGNNLADTTNNYPILTYSYMFNNHPGWSGNAHCAVFNDDGKYYLLHQGRLAPDNLMMILHVREMKWLPSGWPVVSPERYAGYVINNDVTIQGDWEVIILNEIKDQVELWQGQIPPGGWTYKGSEFNKSFLIQFNEDHSTDNEKFSTWGYDNNILKLGTTECLIFNGWDWENEKPTILFSGILENGSSIWGKKVNLINN